MKISACRQKAEEDYWSDILEEASYPELFSPGGCIKKDTCAVSPRSPKVGYNPLLYQEGYIPKITKSKILISPVSRRIHVLYPQKSLKV